MMVSVLVFSKNGIALDDVQAVSAAKIKQLIQKELEKTYLNARIEFTGPLHLSSGDYPAQVEAIVVRGQTARGEALFGVKTDADNEISGSISFSAWMPARVAVKRVRPGQRLEGDQFRLQDVDVASGLGKEYRGVILDPLTPIARLEARQTILEGQFLVSNAAQKVPDLRRGDAVRLQIVSEGLSISLSGTAEEPAYLDGQVRVMAGRAKRELVGRLVSEGVVEVKL